MSSYQAFQSASLVRREEHLQKILQKAELLKKKTVLLVQKFNEFLAGYKKQS